MILSDNGVEHALLVLGAPCTSASLAPISPAYSLPSKDFEKLKSMIALLEPGAICLRHTTVCGGAGGDRAAPFGDDRQR